MQAVQQYVKEQGLTINAKTLQSGSLLSAWAGAQAAAGNADLSGLLRRPGM